MLKNIVLLTTLIFTTILFAGSDLYRFQVHFDTGSYTLKSDDIAALEDFALYLKNHPSVAVEIQGHTDSIGDANKNMRLSELRARTVADALEGYGVDSSRITVRGYGESRPIASNNTENGRYENRRVEAHLQGIDVQNTGQVVLKGTVIDAKNSVPLSVVTLQLFEADSLYTFTTTDTDGRFALHAKPGYYTLTISREGYVEKSIPVTIAEAETTELPAIYLVSDLSLLSAPALSFKQDKIDTNKPKTDIILEVEDTGNGIGKIDFYNNGVKINPELISQKEEKNHHIYKYRIGTPVGKSEIIAVVYDKSNSVKSKPVKLIITAKYKTKPILHALVIGIDRFDNSSLNLNFTDDDAQLMKQVFNQYSTKLFDNVKVTYLAGKSNTNRKNIIRKLKEMKNSVSPNDYFVFYVSSHGYLDTRHNKYYLVPSDASDKSHMISEDELKALMANIDTRYKLVLFDTCHSGKATEAIAKKLMQDKNADVTTISASKTQQVAMEGYKGHGVFTYILAEGLEGAADTDQNKRVDSIEIAHYIQRYLPTISMQRFHKAQDAVVNYTPRSFDVTLLDARYKPEQIVPVEFKKEELPTLIHDLDTQNVSALHNFYAQHEVVPTQNNVPKPKPKPKKRKNSKKDDTKPLFNIGIGVSGYPGNVGYGGELLLMYEPSDLFSYYLTFGKSMSNYADDTYKTGDITSIGAGMRLAILYIGGEVVINHEATANVTKKAKSAFVIGLVGEGRHWGGGLIVKEYDDKTIGDNHTLSGGVTVHYKFF